MTEVQWTSGRATVKTKLKPLSHSDTTLAKGKRLFDDLTSRLSLLLHGLLWLRVWPLVNPVTDTKFARLGVTVHWGLAMSAALDVWGTWVPLITAASALELVHYGICGLSHSCLGHGSEVEVSHLYILPLRNQTLH